MTNLLHLSQTLTDIQQELAREQRFSGDACHSLLKGVALVREAVDALERDIKANFEERDRSVARVLGNSAPFTTTIESEDDQSADEEMAEVVGIEHKKRRNSNG